MKDIFAAFGSEVFRPLVTLLLPGALATSTWIAAGVLGCRTIRELVNTNRTDAWIVGVMLMLFVGLVCEDIGSHLEQGFDDRRDRMDGKQKENWNQYLRIAYRLEPVGHHYLRTVLLRLKFELGCFVACGFALPGLWCLCLPWFTVLVFSILGLGIGGFFLYESWESHQLLGKIRAEILKGITELPSHPTNGPVHG